MREDSSECLDLQHVLYMCHRRLRRTRMSQRYGRSISHPHWRAKHRRLNRVFGIRIESDRIHGAARDVTNRTDAPVLGRRQNPVPAQERPPWLNGVKLYWDRKIAKDRSEEHTAARCIKRLVIDDTDARGRQAVLAAAKLIIGFVDRLADPSRRGAISTSRHQADQSKWPLGAVIDQRLPDHSCLPRIRHSLAA
jgi:hypothetical protein